MFKGTICALLVLSAPALADYYVDLDAPGGGSLITLPAAPVTDQVFDIGVYVDADGLGESYIAAEMKFMASSPALSLRGVIGSMGLSGQGSRYNDALFDAGTGDFDMCHDPDVMVATAAFPGPSGPYGTAVTFAAGEDPVPLSGRNLLGYLSVKLAAGTPEGVYTLRTAGYTESYNGATVTTSDWGQLYVPISTITFEVLPEPAAGLLLIAALPLLRRRSREQA